MRQFCIYSANDIPIHHCSKHLFWWLTSWIPLRRLCVWSVIKICKGWKSEFGCNLSEEKCNTSEALAQSQRIDDVISKGQSHACSIESVAEEFVSWPGMESNTLVWKEARIPSNFPCHGSMAEVNTSSTHKERFVGGDSEDDEGSDIGVIQEFWTTIIILILITRLQIDCRD